MNARRLSCALFALIATSSLLLGESTTWKAVVSCGWQDFPYSSHIDTVALPSGITESLSLDIYSPTGVAITPDGTKAVVANASNYTAGGTGVVLILDLTQPITTLIGSPIGMPQEDLLGVAITPDGTTAIVIGQNTINFIDIPSVQLVSTLSPPLSFNGPVAITPDGTTAFVPWSNNSVTVDVANRTTSSGFTTSSNATGLAATPDGKSMLAVCGSSVNVIDLTSFSVTAIIPLASTGVDIAISSDGALALVNSDSGTVTAIDLGTLQVIGDPISLSGSLRHIAITPDAKQALVSNYSDSLVYTLDLTQISGLTSSSSTGISYITTDSKPTYCAITPDQAPTARFTFSAQGKKFFFDGSDSTSPIGGIKSYIWDFGDGSSRTTSTPQVSHAYSGIGPFTVTLTVVNDGGTSLDVTFTGQTVSNNGGPSARTSGVVTGLTQPTAFRGKVHHSRHKRSEMKTHWNKSQNAKEYQIFAHSKKIASIRASHKPEKKIRLHSPHEHLSRKYRHYLHEKYKVRAVDVSGNASPFTELYAR